MCLNVLFSYSFETEEIVIKKNKKKPHVKLFLVTTQHMLESLHEEGFLFNVGDSIGWF